MKLQQRKCNAPPCERRRRSLKSHASSIAAVALLVTALAAANGGAARAASSYDQLINKTDFSIRYGCGGNPANCNDQSNWTEPFTIYDTYQLKMQESNDTTCQAATQYWLQNQGDTRYWQNINKIYLVTQGGWQLSNGITQDKETTNILWSFGKTTSSFTPFVTWSENTLYKMAQLSYISSSAPATVNDNGMYNIRFSPIPNQEGEYNVSCTGGQAGTFGAYALTIAQYRIQEQAYVVKPILTSEWLDKNYPEGYEGKLISAVYTPPRTDTPDLKLMEVSDWKGKFSDKNFLTIDDVPFTCSEGLAPVISGTLFDGGGNQMDTFTANSTALFTINLPEENTDTDYYIESKYTCDDGINEFNETARYDFTITAYGTLKNEDMFTDCVDSDFPYVHITDCVKNVYELLNILTVGTIHIGADLETGSNCHTLEVLGGWINKPGMTVCPAVPSVIRTAITPLVLLLVAMGIVKMVNMGIHNVRVN